MSQRFLLISTMITVIVVSQTLTIPYIGQGWQDWRTLDVLRNRWRQVHQQHYMRLVDGR